MYVTYILISLKWPKTYTGYTNDFERRLNEHNAGKSNFSKKYRPWKLLYKEVYNTKEEAIKREKYFKSGAGRRFIKNNFFIN